MAKLETRYTINGKPTKQKVFRNTYQKFWDWAMAEIKYTVYGMPSRQVAFEGTYQECCDWLTERKNLLRNMFNGEEGLKWH